MTIPQSTKKEIGHEYVSEGEDALIGEMIEEMKSQLTRLYPAKKPSTEDPISMEDPARMPRQVHTKMHGCVKAAFTVLPGLSPELRVGVFKEPLTYPTWIRFSNANTIVHPDKKKDVRGVAIKLMNVPGEKL